MTAFGKALRAARERRQMTQGDLTQAVGGVAQSSVSAWENGVMEPPPATVFRIEQILNVKPGAIAQHLGYVPAHVRAITKADVFDAILRDTSISKRDRDALLALYTTLSGVEPKQRRRITSA